MTSRVYMFETTSASRKRLRQGPPACTISPENKRCKVSPTSLEKLAYFNSDSWKGTASYSLSKAALRAKYAHMQVLREKYDRFVPSFFDLDMETSLADIDAIKDGDDLMREMDVSERKYSVLRKAVAKSVRETLKKNPREGVAPSVHREMEACSPRMGIGRPPHMNAYLTAVMSSEDYSDDDEED